MSKWLAAFIVFLLAVLVGAYYWLDPESKALDAAERERLGGSYVQLSDGVTHYALSGPADADLVVLVHGGTVPMWSWEKQAAALTGAGYRVLMYDQFGRGYSDRPAVTYDKALFTRQLIELVDKLALTQKFHLIGVSFGGATAVRFAAEYPERVRSLVLISPLFSDFEVPTVFRIPVIGELAARTIGIDMIVKRLAILLRGVPDAARYQKLFVDQTTYKGFQRALLSMVRTDALRDYSNEYQTVGQQKRHALLIWGTADEEIGPETMDKVRAAIPNIRFEPVEGAGHGIMLQKPEVVNDLILRFLREPPKISGQRAAAISPDTLRLAPRPG